MNMYFHYISHYKFEYIQGLYIYNDIHVCYRIQLFATPWTVAHQAPLSMGFPRQEYWSGLPFPPPEDLPDLGIKTASLMSPSLQVDSLPLSQLGNLYIDINVPIYIAI